MSNQIDRVIIIYSQSLVDPAFLYGLDIPRPGKQHKRPKIIVVDDSYQAADGRPMRVNRPDTEVLSHSLSDLGISRGSTLMLASGLLKAWNMKVKYIHIVSDKAVLPNSYTHFYDQAFNDGPEQKITSNSGWINPLGHDYIFSVGFPTYLRQGWDFSFKTLSSEDRQVALHMGLTRGDTEISSLGRSKKIEHPAFRNISLEPIGYIPISYTNICFRLDLLPLMLPFPIAKKGSSFLSGIIIQEAVNAKNECISFGKPLVRRISDVVDVELEMLEQLVLPEFHSYIKTLVKQSPSTSYLDTLSHIAQTFDPLAMGAWSDHFADSALILRSWTDALRSEHSS